MVMVIYLVLVLLLGAVAGCRSFGEEVQATAEAAVGGVQGVTLEVSSFKFRPNVITVEAGKPLRIAAVSRAWVIPHNVTILALDGSVLKSQDVSPGGEVEVEVTFTKPGQYILYCNKFLHRSFGQEGLFIAR